MHVGELLNVFAKQSLHLAVGVVGNGLKLIKCHKAGLPRRFEIGEYLLQGGVLGLWLDIYHTLWRARNGICGDDGTYAGKKRGDVFPHLVGEGRYLLAENGLRKTLRELSKVGRSINIYVEKECIFFPV